jgi:inositol 1,4,5-triphosphate receptor type 3
MLNTSYDPNSRGLYIVRFVYDFTFFLAVNLIFLNMLSGLIIDAFAELRDQKTITEEKKRNICYVCSISRNRVNKYKP